MTIRLTPGDLAEAALWMHGIADGTYGDVANFISEHYDNNPDVKQPPTWSECIEWETDYGDMARQLAADIPRLVEIEADRRVSEMLKEGGKT